MVAVGSAVPERIVTNAELAGQVDTTDEWIRSRTGIRERRVVAEGELTSDLATRTAEQALDRSGLAPAAIDLVLVATTTPDYYFPSVAALVADRVGAHNAAACDISAACSGFVYALAQAVGQIESGLAEHVLVVGAEAMSRITDWSDRATCILFGDGAGAVVVSAGAHADERSFAVELGSDGSRSEHLQVRALEPGNRFIEMNGGEVFRFATRAMVEASGRVLERASMTPGDVDWWVPHQANQRIIDHAVKRLGIDGDRVLTNLDRYGNTSAGSIPLMLAEAWQDGRVQAGQQLLLVGFGAGLSWGAILTTWAGAGVEPS